MSRTAKEIKISFDWVEIPSGRFLMGSNPVQSLVPYSDESPQHQIYLEEFYISAKPITNSQYAEFVASTGYKNLVTGLGE